jgi:HlyD family secretion protein
MEKGRFALRFKKLVFLLPLLALGAALWWGYARRSEPPEAPFARAARETLVSTLATNGKVEPFTWEPVRAESAGLVVRVPVQEGQRLAQGAPLAYLTGTGREADIQAAEARLAEARASLATLEAGGPPAELADIDSSLARARFELAENRRQHASLLRLLEKSAVTRIEVDAAAAKVRQSELEVEAFTKRRAALVGAGDVAVARARVRDAEAALALARQRLTQTVIHSPASGTVYGLAVRAGAYLDAGGMVANVGSFERLLVRVYVDEPELGRVARGQRVTLTWDALPGKSWLGTVEKQPAAIQALGTRQVGEVLCRIENPGRDLIPGTNVNAEIRTAVVENAVVIPKECLRRDGAGEFVFAARGNRVARQVVRTGVSSVTRLQILEGLQPGDAVALPTDVALKPGLAVRPVFR